MTLAENTPAPAGEAPNPAPGAEVSIPKYRLDEVSAELRRVREELAMKDRLYMEERQRQLAPQPAEVDNPEEYGLDEQTYKGVKKLAAKMAAGIVRERTQVFEQQIGILANRTEKAELLVSKGSGAAKYLPEIERMQQEHFQRTGAFMPKEIAHELLVAKEKDERIRQLEARLAGQAPAPEAAPTPAAQAAIPSAAGTRQIHSGGAVPAPANKNFSELSVEEMEARLDEQFKQGHTA